MSNWGIRFPLKPIPSADWENKANFLLKDAWLRKKVDRDRRLEEHWNYLTKYASNVLTSSTKRGLVIDLGCGLGELLEICQSLGHDAIGVDAETGIGGMGDNYLQFAKLMQDRQKLDVHRVGFNKWLLHSKQRVGTALLINSRGSFEQMNAEWMDGPPHHEHQSAAKLSWRMGQPLCDHLTWVLRSCRRLLRNDGTFLVHCNGSENRDKFEPVFLGIAERVGLKLLKHETNLYQWGRGDESIDFA